MIGLIKKLDFFSINQSIKIEGQNNYKTLFGGIMTILLALTYITGVIYFGSELWLKQKPKVIVSAANFENPFPISVNIQAFNIYTAIQDQNSMEVVDPKVFRVSAVNNVFEYDENHNVKLTSNQLEIDLCNKYYSNSTQLSNDTIVNLNGFYCLKPNQFFIEGYWGSRIYSDLNIIFEKCVNSTTSEVICEDEKVINKKLAFLSFYAVNNILYPESYDNPVVTYLEDNYNVLTPDLTYDIILYLKMMNFKTDIGFLLESNDIKNSFYFEKPTYHYFSRRDPIIAVFNVKSYRLGQSIARTYTKIQDVATNVGGLLKILTMLASIISNLVSKIEFTNDFLYNLEVRSAKKESFLINKNLKLKDNESSSIQKIKLQTNNFTNITKVKKRSVHEENPIFYGEQNS